MIDVYAYHTERQEFIDNLTITDVPQYMDDPLVWLWIDFDCPAEDEKYFLKSVFNFDDYAIEDCFHPRQFPKLESFEEYHFFIVQGAGPADDAKPFTSSELDGFLGDRFLVTYHDTAIPIIQEAKKRLQQPNSRFKQGTAYLAYELLDQMIDTYLPIMDYFDQCISQLEMLMESTPLTNQPAQTYFSLSSQLLALRRVAIKHQYVFYQFSHYPLQFIDTDEARLFRDIHDHAVRVVDMAEYYQQSLHNALNIQFSLNSSRVNQVVQFLTVFATIMLPLNVITGIYGMNFDWMPFLHHPHGFWFVSAFMAFIVITLMHTFYRRRWL